MLCPARKTKSGKKAKVERNADPKDYELKEGERISQLLVDGGVVARTLRIPFNDVFGLTDAFKQMTPAAEIASELFSFLRIAISWRMEAMPRKT